MPTYLLNRYLDSPLNSYRLEVQRIITFAGGISGVVLTPGEYEMMPSAIPTLNFNMAVRISKFRIADRKSVV